MKICTHEKIDRRLCGEPLNIKSGYSKDTTIFTGTFTCFVLEKHILS